MESRSRRFSKRARPLQLTDRHGLWTIRFPGQYYDAETGLHYNRFRYYDPAVGRYISTDPIGQFGGPNLYTYALNDPTNLVDPLGLVLGQIGVRGTAVAGVGFGGEASVIGGSREGATGPFGSRELGVAVQGETAGGFEVGGEVFIGFSNDTDTNSVTASIDTGPVGFDFEFDPQTGDLTAASVGIGPGLPGATVGFAVGADGTVSELAEYLARLFGFLPPADDGKEDCE